MIHFLALIISFSISQAAGEHREHKKHQHGHAEMTIAFDGLVGKIELETPTGAIVGFEHEAKTDKQKKQKDEALLKLEKSMAEMVVFDAKLNCKVSKNTFEIEADSDNKNHSELEGSFDVSCEKSIEGSTLLFNFQKTFPQLNVVDVTVLAGSIQKSLKVKKNGTALEVK